MFSRSLTVIFLPIIDRSDFILVRQRPYEMTVQFGHEDRSAGVNIRPMAALFPSKSKNPGETRALTTLTEPSGACRTGLNQEYPAIASTVLLRCAHSAVLRKRYSSS